MNYKNNNYPIYNTTKWNFSMIKIHQLDFLFSMQLSINTFSHTSMNHSSVIKKWEYRYKLSRKENCRIKWIIVLPKKHKLKRLINLLSNNELLSPVKDSETIKYQLQILQSPKSDVSILTVSWKVIKKMLTHLMFVLSLRSVLHRFD